MLFSMPDPFHAHRGFWTAARKRSLAVGLLLLAHVHYSIDVFAASLIVYGIFTITKKLFPADYALVDGR